MRIAPPLLFVVGRMPAIHGISNKWCRSFEHFRIQHLQAFVLRSHPHFTTYTHTHKQSLTEIEYASAMNQFLVRMSCHSPNTADKQFSCIQ
eukprot:m.541266 g.541266  ORF g.541266 m.541266 type:complete len:91 (-) comp22107_c0_seq1:26-298(-)